MSADHSQTHGSVLVFVSPASSSESLGIRTDVVDGRPPPKKCDLKLSSAPSSGHKSKKSANQTEGRQTQGGGAYLQLLSGRTRPPSASAADCCSPERQDIGSEDVKSPSRTPGTAADLVGVDGHRDNGGRVQDAPPFGQRLPGAGLSHLRLGGDPGYSGLLQMLVNPSPTGLCCLWDLLLQFFHKVQHLNLKDN